MANSIVICIAVVLIISIFSLSFIYYLSQKCKHNFEVLDVLRVYVKSSDKYPSYRDYVLKCKHCGIVTKNRL